MRAMEERTAVQAEASDMLATCKSELEGIFTKWEKGEGNLSSVEETLGKMKYLQNLVNA